MTAKLVLLPGMDGTGTLFSGLVKELGGEIECHVVSYPSEVPLGYGALESIARASLSENGKVFVLGESFSGPIAISLAAECPERIAGAILCRRLAKAKL